MPATKNAMIRYKILDELLSDKYHDYSLNDLTDEVSNRLGDICSNTNGVVRRTIEKDIRFLEKEGPFLVEIKRYPATYFNIEEQKTCTKQCLKYADPSFSIFKKQLSSDEKYLLQETLNLLGYFEGLPNLSNLELLRSNLGFKGNGQSIISFTRNPIQESNILGELFTAISQKQVVTLIYHKFGELEKQKELTLHPYLIKEYNNRWYLFGATEDDGTLLCFGIERIDRIIPLPSHKYVKYEGNFDDLFEDIIGVTLFKGARIHEICFWVSDISKEYVLTKPLHESQKKVSPNKETEIRSKYPMLENGILLQIECKFNYELIRELTSFGKELIVLGDAYIQNKVAFRIKKMYESYQNICDLFKHSYNSKA